jgi:hypothetical protein
MKITRDVVVDLLPLYLSGEASAATRELVDEYLRQDPVLAEQVRAHRIEGLPPVAPPPLPELELRSLRRTRGLISVQKWLCAFATMFTAIGLALRIHFHDGRFADAHLLVIEHPEIFGPCLLIALVLWIGYFAVRRRWRASAL